MKRLFTYLEENLEEILMVVLLGAISLVIFAQVIARLFNKGFPWAEEFCRYCFVYSGLLSAGYCVRKGVGIRVDALYGFFPKGLKLAIDYAGKILLTAIYAYLAWGSIGLIANTTNLSTAIQLPMKYVYMSIPLGFGLGAIRGVQDLV
ncbi:MAG: TRAP transporter small permease, partial [Lawsonibacter sp.]|nr:TRAP transporter small permease [Lawsonibacter sp.]